MTVEVVDTGVGLQAVGNYTQVPAGRVQLSKGGPGGGKACSGTEQGTLTFVHCGQLELWTAQGTPL